VSLGKAVEQGPKDAIFARPTHPYTQALLASTPSLRRREPYARRVVAAGEVPSPLALATGCAFRTRCGRAIARCASETPIPVTIGSVRVACHRAQDGR